MIILKEEINQLGSQITHLATWKLIAVGTFAAVGLLGWDNIQTDKKTGPLLLCCVGYLCAYIDSLYYRRATAIHVIAGYLRVYTGSDDDMRELCRYERAIRHIRKRSGFFLSDLWPQFVASLVFTLGLPGLAVIRYTYCPDDWWIHLVPIVAVAFVLQIALFSVFIWKRKALST